MEFKSTINRADNVIIRDLFFNSFNKIPEITALPGGGSSRRYYRLCNDDISVVAAVGDDIQENKAFLALSRLLHTNNLNVPQIISVSPDFHVYIMEDLGNTSLFSILTNPDKMDWSKKALSQLICMQTLPVSVWENETGFRPFSERLIRWDLNYFKYDFLKPADIEFDEDALEDDFDNLVASLMNQSSIQGLMYRDFQSRNIMVKDNKLFFIDYQGARKGPLTYDAASFIWQAKAPFSFEEREELKKFYADKLSETINSNPQSVLVQLESMELFRTLQVLGAYGFRGLIEKKSHFLESITPAIKNLNYFKEKGRLSQFPELDKIATRLMQSKFAAIKKSSDKLQLQVFSFSYKKGYPEDMSGNGGGFMFDCRAIHNPGRYPEFKDKTGMDREVIEFLAYTPDAGNFVENAVTIVEPSIKRYLQRGFTSLQVGFGCTGGQHRSVWCAEVFARKMSEKFPGITVEVIHREQSVRKSF